jgi:hypothetical protein
MLRSSMPRFIRLTETALREKSMNGCSRKVISIAPKQGKRGNRGPSSSLSNPVKVMSEISRRLC